MMNTKRLLGSHQIPRPCPEVLLDVNNGQVEMSTPQLQVPLVDLSRQYGEISNEIDETALRVLASGRYILGPEVEAFEREMAAYIGVAHGVGVASGTEALYLILKALGVGPGDEVVMTAFTYIATAEAIANCGAKPVFADIDPGTFNVDPGSVLEKLTRRTRAVIVVHLYGLPAELSELREITKREGLDIIEDCAQAHGATYGGKKVGSFGRASAFSFFPTKPLGAMGDGGMVCTDDGELARSLKALRAHGSSGGYRSEELGINSRLDELQAAILRVKLGFLDQWNAERRRIAEFYREALRGVTVPDVPQGVEHVFHMYTVRSGDRDGLKEALDKAGVDSRVYYPVPMHLQPCFAGLGYRPGDFPESERASGEVLSLPIFYGITAPEIEAVCSAVNRWSG
jgi:dTDP-4-amino-4,6-dideoxygalactose transaminase